MNLYTGVLTISTILNTVQFIDSVKCKVQ